MHPFIIIKTTLDWLALPESPALLSLVKKLKRHRLTDKLFSQRQALRTSIQALALDCKVLSTLDERCLTHTELHAQAIQDFTDRDALLKKIRTHLDTLTPQLAQLPLLTRLHLGRSCIKQTFHELSTWRNQTHTALITHQKHLEHQLVLQHQQAYQAQAATFTQALPANQPKMESYRWASTTWQSIYTAIQTKWSQLADNIPATPRRSVSSPKTPERLSPRKTKFSREEYYDPKPIADALIHQLQMSFDALAKSAEPKTFKRYCSALHTVVETIANRHAFFDFSRHERQKVAHHLHHADINALPALSDTQRHHLKVLTQDTIGFISARSPNKEAKLVEPNESPLANRWLKRLSTPTLDNSVCRVLFPDNTTPTLHA